MAIKKSKITSRRKRTPIISSKSKPNFKRKYNDENSNTKKKIEAETEKKIVACLNLSPHSILQTYTLPCKRSHIEPELEEFFLHEHSISCQLMGYLPIADSISVAPLGPYVSAEEKKRQLTAASGTKREALREKWGMDQGHLRLERRKRKELLRAGKFSYNCIKSVRSDNPRSLEVAKLASITVKVEEPLPVVEEEEQPAIKDKATKRRELKERDELKKVKEASKKVKKRKDILNRVAEEKKDRRAAMIAAAVPGFKETDQEEEKIKEEAPGKLKGKAPGALGAPSAPQFVFNIEEKQKKVIATEEKKKKKKPTIDELKQQLKDELEKRKMLSALKASGENSLAKEVITTHNWQQANRKMQGEKVESINNLSRDLKRAQLKEKNKGKKVKDQLQQQKQEKHKKTIKRQQNLRTQRVGRLAQKMKKFSKKGHIVPGFM